MEINYKTAKLENLSLAYLDAGSSERVVLLLHGFASTAKVNWHSTGWIEFLTSHGFRCIAPDHRGHGGSDKFYTPHEYGPDIFANDAKNLLEHLGIKKCAVLGFSMGARIATWFAYEYSQYANCFILGGMGDGIIQPKLNHEQIAHAFEVEDANEITDKVGIAFRTFADRTGSDRLALAACIRPSRQKITKEILAKITLPSLIVVGSDDAIAGSAAGLGKMLCNSQAIVLPSLDHMRTSGSAEFKHVAISFLQGVYK